MTAPGDPLIQGPGGPRFQAALAKYRAQGFTELQDQIEAAVVNAIPRETRLTWEAKKGAHIVRGYIATIESGDKSGKTAVFEVHYVAVNDRRNPTHLTFGTFAESEKAKLTDFFGGNRAKGGRS